jgi:hypothetical protein
MKPKHVSVLSLILMAFLLCYLAGCSDETPLNTTGSAPDGLNLVMSETVGDVTVPSPLVDVTWGSETLTFWPYSGENFSGTPSDPVNLVFAGHVTPLQVRAALLGLDGNRTGCGLPNIFPLNATWTDCIGNVQTTYTENDEWVGGVIQLQLGDYSIMRAHLRLWQTTAPYGSDGTWTVGAAHFEVRIPGTAEHQVLAWELAQGIVTCDLVRSGLLAAGTPALTGVINSAPSFRTIPAVIYNGIPDPLKVLCGLPPGPSSVPVPIPNDGKAAILCVEGEAPVEDGATSQEFTVEYNQVVPAPFCSAGPYDYVYLSGPLVHEKVVTISSGRFQYSSSITGHLTATPMNVLVNPPVPAGEPFKVIIGDAQRGILDGDFYRVTFEQSRVAPTNPGVEKLMIMLHVSSNGEEIYKSKTQCLGPEE